MEIQPCVDDVMSALSGHILPSQVPEIQLDQPLEPQQVPEIHHQLAEVDGSVAAMKASFAMLDSTTNFGDTNILENDGFFMVGEPDNSTVEESTNMVESNSQLFEVFSKMVKSKSNSNLPEVFSNMVDSNSHLPEVLIYDPSLLLKREPDIIPGLFIEVSLFYIQLIGIIYLFLR